MSAVVYFKTDAGRDEIQSRTLKLPSALRSILVMIDGQRDSAELGEMAASLRAPADALEQLLAQGLIEARDGAAAPAPTPQAKPVPAPAVPSAAPAISAGDAQRFTNAYQLAIDAVGKHLGIKGYFLQLKVERCTNFAELDEVLPEVAEALAKAKSDALAKRFLSEARGLEPA